jgi:hypothetical protein
MTTKSAWARSSVLRIRSRSPVFSYRLAALARTAARSQRSGEAAARANSCSIRPVSPAKPVTMQRSTSRPGNGGSAAADSSSLTCVSWVRVDSQLARSPSGLSITSAITRAARAYARPGSSDPALTSRISLAQPIISVLVSSTAQYQASASNTVRARSP